MTWIFTHWEVAAAILGLMFLQAILTVVFVRIFYGRPISVTELQALQAAITQLQTDISALVASGVIAGSALSPLVASVNAMDAQVKSLLPTTPAPAA